MSWLLWDVSAQPRLNLCGLRRTVFAGMTRFKLGDRVVVNSPVKETYKGQVGEVVAMDLIEWEAGKVIESYVVEFRDHTRQTFVGAALILHTSAAI